MRAELAITRADFMAVEVPRSGTFGLQRGTTPDKSPFTIVRLSTDSGLIGYGEGCTTVRGLHLLGTSNLAPILVGENPFNVTRIHAKMDQVEMMRVERLGHWNVLRAAVDLALWDIMGKALDVPLYDLLGGAQRRRIKVVKNIGAGDATTSAARAAELVSEGYTTLKVRVGRSVRSDLDRLRAIRETVGPDVDIRLDANQAWDSKTAVAAIRVFAEYGLEAVESPCKFWDIRGAAEVVSAVPVPIISDEGFWTVGESQSVLSAGAADVLHIYLGKCGGITPSRKMVALAEGFDKGIALGERVPLGIAEAAHLQFAASLSSLRFPCALGYDLNEDDLLVTPIPRRNGEIEVPTGPGLGVVVDEDRIDRYRVNE